MYADKEAKNDVFKRVNRSIQNDKPSMIISTSSSVTEPSKIIRISSVAPADNSNGTVQKTTSSVFARLGGKQNDNDDDDDDVAIAKNSEMFSGILKKAPIKVKLTNYIKF